MRTGYGCCRTPSCTLPAVGTSLRSHARRGKKFHAAYEHYSEQQKRHLDQYDWWTWLGKMGFNHEDRRIHELIDSTDFGESIRQVSAYVAAEEYTDTDYTNPNNTDEMDWHVIGGNSNLAQALANRLTPALCI